jgi:hypothetical protein
LNEQHCLADHLQRRLDRFIFVPCHLSMGTLRQNRLKRQRLSTHATLGSTGIAGITTFAARGRRPNQAR